MFNFVHFPFRTADWHFTVIGLLSSRSSRISTSVLPSSFSSSLSASPPTSRPRPCSWPPTLGPHSVLNSVRSWLGASDLRWPCIRQHKFLVSFLASFREPIRSLLPLLCRPLSIIISGAHLNPAISLAQLCRGTISPLRFVLYVPAQLVGAFIGAALAFLGHFGIRVFICLNKQTNKHAHPILQTTTEDCSNIRSGNGGDQRLGELYVWFIEFHCIIRSSSIFPLIAASQFATYPRQASA